MDIAPIGGDVLAIMPLIPVILVEIGAIMAYVASVGGNGPIVVVNILLVARDSRLVFRQIFIVVVSEIVAVLGVGSIKLPFVLVAVAALRINFRVVFADIAAIGVVVTIIFAQILTVFVNVIAIVPQVAPIMMNVR
jgi:hypothetical protein